MADALVPFGEQMQLAGLSDGTRDRYLCALRHLAEHTGKDLRKDLPAGRGGPPPFWAARRVPSPQGKNRGASLPAPARPAEGARGDAPEPPQPPLRRRRLAALMARRPGRSPCVARRRPRQCRHGVDAALSIIGRSQWLGST